MIVFFLVSTLIIWGMCAASGLWLLTCFPVLGRLSPAGICPILGTILILAAFTLTRTHYNIVTQLLYYTGYILFGFVFIAFCVTVASAVVYSIFKLLHIPLNAYIGPASVCVMLVLFVCAVWGGFSSPALKRIAITSSKLPPIKIALISDSHLGMGVSYARWDRALSRLEAEKPDLLLVLGDVFEYGPDADKFAQRLASFKTPLGTYGVLGNHEYYNDYQQALDFYQKANIHLLQNQTALLYNGIQIAGVKDIKTAGVDRQDLVDLLAAAKPNQPLILLSHTPLYAEEASTHGADLMLSGHTHNGQIWPFNYLVRLQFPRVYGLFDVNGMPFYITSGMFYWGIPLRLFSPAELPIVEVNL